MQSSQAGLFHLLGQAPDPRYPPGLPMGHWSTCVRWNSITLEAINYSSRRKNRQKLLLSTENRELYKVKE